MPHRECLTEEEMTAYQLGELPPDQSAALAEHLEGCPRCAAEVARLDDLADGVIAALRHHPPPTPGQPRACPGPDLDTRTLRRGQAPEPAPPQSLSDYEVMEELGRGGMGVVYKARQVKLNRTVALKMVLAGGRAGPSELTRFLIEAEMVARLSHPNIVAIHEVGTHEGRPFIALEYVPGGTLADRLDGRPWPARAAAALLEQLAQAVDHAHRQGVVHRDLKPANILLAPPPPAPPHPPTPSPSSPPHPPAPSPTKGERGSKRALAPPSPAKVGEGGWGGEGAVPKITDFGLAKLVTWGAGLTTTGTVLGTPTYMAPEQAQGGGRVGPAADVYALGCILYELLAGRPPFDGQTPMEVLLKATTLEAPPLSKARSPSSPTCPRDLCVICHRCLEKDPRRRYGTAGELAEDLARFLAGEPIHARRVGELERAWLWARRRPAVAGLLLAVALSLLGGMGTSAYLARREYAAAADARGARDEARQAGGKAEEKAEEARAAAKKAKEAEEKALAAKQEAERWAGRLAFRSGVAEAEAGRVDRGLFLMLRALRSAPDDPEFQRVVRANLTAWAARQPVLAQAFPGEDRGSWFLGPLGDTFATATPENTLQSFQTATGQKLGEPTRHALPGQIRALSRDGRTAIVREGKTLRLYETGAGRPVGKPLTEDFNAYTLLGFAPGDDVVWARLEIERDGKVLDRTRLFRVSTGQPVGTEVTEDFRLFQGREGRTVRMTFPHPELGKSEAAVQARFTDLTGGPLPASWGPDPSGGDATVRFDGRWVVTLGRDGLVRWWDPATGVQGRKPWRPAGAYRGGPAALLAGGLTLVIVRTDERVAWFDLTSGRQHPLSLPTSYHPSLAVRPDGTALLLGSEKDGLRLWRLESLPPPALAPEGEPRFVEVAYSPDHRLVYTGTRWAAQGPYGLLTEAATGRPVGAPLSSVTIDPVFSGDGKLLATHTASVTEQHVAFVNVRDTGTGQVRALRPPNYVHGLAFAPDNRTLAFGTIGELYIWDTQAPRTRPVLRQDAPVSQLLFSPDGKWLATGSLRGWTGMKSCFCVWEVATGRRVGEPEPTEDAPRFAFSPDCRILYTLELPSARLRRWDPATRKQLGEQAVLKGGRVSHAVFSADSRRVLTGYPDGQARQWDTATGQPVGRALSHPAPVSALAFSPDGKHLAVGCEDGSVWVWDADAGVAVGPPLLHRKAVRGLAFRKDGRALLSTGEDGLTVRSAVTEGTAWPAQAGPDVLEAWLRSRCGVRLEGDAVALLDAEQWQEARRQLEARSSASVSGGVDSGGPSAASLERWYEDRAREAEATGAADSWSLDRLIEVQGPASPTSWLARARRAHLHARAGRLEVAHEEYKTLASVAGEDLLAWYGHRAAEARFDGPGGWPLARWYLGLLLAARPGQWQLYAERAAVGALEGKKAESWADQLQAVERGADFYYVLGLADDLAGEGSWQKAKQVLERADRKWGFNLLVCERAALAYLQLGEADRYRALCARAMKQPGLRLDSVYSLCVLGPGAVRDWTPLLAQTERLQKQLAELERREMPENVRAVIRYRCLYIRVGVLYRAGKGAEALALGKRFREAGGEDDGLHWPLLAMVHASQGQRAEAERCLAQSRRWLQAHQPVRSNWFSRVAVQLLHDEAEKLLAEQEGEQIPGPGPEGP